MGFNFGDQPWKFPPVEGFQGFAQASNPVPNMKSGKTQDRKLVKNAPQALIIEPSRELAEQTYEQLRLFKAHLGAPNVREQLGKNNFKMRNLNFPALLSLISPQKK